MTWPRGVVAWRTSLFWRINRGGEDLRLIDRWKQARVGGQRGSRGIWSWEIYGAGDKLRGRGRYVRGEMMHKWNKDERIEHRGRVSSGSHCSWPLELVIFGIVFQLAKIVFILPPPSLPCRLSFHQILSVYSIGPWVNPICLGLFEHI